MKLRVNLFLKMFVGFWLATIIIASSWILTNRYFDEQPEEAARLESQGRKVPHRFMLRKLYDLQHADSGDMSAVLTQSDHAGRVTIYLLDRSGRDWLKRDVSTEVASAAQKLDRRRRAMIRKDGLRYVAHRVFRADSGSLRAVFQFEPPPPTVLGLLGASPALRLALAVGISGLVCYVLSRLLTSRLAQLRETSNRFAEGDLDARAPVRRHGGDETDQLARDFNTMAEQLQERIVTQKQLLSDVSHELRSPLARLHVALALAQKSPGKDTEMLARIEQEAERLEDLIAQLLSSQTTNTELDEHIDLVKLLKVIVEDAQFESKAQEKRVQLFCDVEEAVIPSKGDLLRKGLENIVRNAITHSPTGGTVSISFEQSTDNETARYNIVIADQGPGVRPQDLERIFAPFYRVDSARTRESGGHGLGLAIARRAVEMHHGSISAANSLDGFEVTVSLPRSSTVANG